MPTEPIEVVEPSSDPEAQQAKISEITKEFLREMVGRLSQVEAEPLIIVVGVAAECGVYTNGISRADLNAYQPTTELITELADLVKKKVMNLGTVSVYPEPAKGTGS